MLGQGSLNKKSQVDLRFDQASDVKLMLQLVLNTIAQYSCLLFLAIPAENVLHERLIELSWRPKSPNNYFY